MALAEPPSPPTSSGRPADRSLAVRPIHDVNIVHGNVYEHYADYTRTAVAAPEDSPTLFSAKFVLQKVSIFNFCDRLRSVADAFFLRQAIFIVDSADTR